MTNLILVAGTRPEAIKMAPVIERLQKQSIDFMFVWSGQHYDYEMSKTFFDQLGLPRPDYDLGIRSGTHSQQTAKAMIKLERIVHQHKPSIVVSEGDTNSVAASAMASVKSLEPFAHVEAGLRSWNMTMPEEVNRRIADSIATLHFAPSKLAALNLLLEGVSDRGLHLTGNTIVDIVNKHINTAKRIGERLLAELNLEKKRYLLVTLHRAENTDDRSRLESILASLKKLSQEFTVVFPLHPRTTKRIAQLELNGLLDGVKRLGPVGYWEFLGLLTNSLAVLTDSGGVQEEACILRIPTITLRYNTERPETVLCGNVLAGANTQAIINLVHKQVGLADTLRKTGLQNPYGDGHAGDKIAEVLKKSIEENLKIVEPDLRRIPFVTYRLLNARQTASESNVETLVVFDKLGRSHLATDARDPRSKRLVRIAHSTL